MANEQGARSPNTVAPPVQGAVRRRRITKLNFMLLVGVIVAGLLFYKAEQQRREVAKQLEETNAQLENVRSGASAGTERGDAEVAQEILTKVRKHFIIPESPPPTVASIVDIESLRSANTFYNAANNGDYLVITERRALLYDPDQDVVLDVVPVRSGTNQTEAAASGSAEEKTPAPGPKSEAVRTAPATGRTTTSPAATP